MLNKTNTLWVAVFAFIVCLFYALNKSLPYVMDDLLYVYIFPENHEDSVQFNFNERIQSYSDIVTSQWNHYFSNNGRVLVRFIVQCFCGLWGKGVYNFCAAMMICLLGILLCRMSFRGRISILEGAIISLTIFLMLIPEPSCLFNGISYSVNYLWTSVFCLSFIYLLTQHRRNTFENILLCVTAILSGWSHEGLTIGVAGGLLVWTFQHKNSINRTQWVAIILFAVAMALLVFAPSNFQRAANLDKSSSTWLGDFWGLHLRVFRFLKASYVWICAVLTLFIIQKDRLLNYVRYNISWVTAWVVSLLFICAIGALNTRAAFGIDFFAVIMILRLLGQYEQFYKKSVVISLISSFIIIGGGIVILKSQLRASQQYYRIHQVLSTSKDEDCLILTQKAEIQWWLRQYISHFKFEEPWEASWWEEVFAWHYGKRKVVIAEVDSIDNTTSLSECIASGRYKMPGDNPFHQIGNYLYSEHAVESRVQLEVQGGDVQVHGLGSFAKWISNTQPHKEESWELYSNKYSFQGKEVYQIPLPINYAHEISLIRLVK